MQCFIQLPSITTERILWNVEFPQAREGKFRCCRMLESAAERTHDSGAQDCTPLMRTCVVACPRLREVRPYGGIYSGRCKKRERATSNKTMKIVFVLRSADYPNLSLFSSLLISMIWAFFWHHTMFARAPPWIPTTTRALWNNCTSSNNCFAGRSNTTKR